ncbi:Fanconi anemia group J protein homolog [Anabrus simplex]|uniref:Fanconi anemia group J protein homolog n=1 Tax=Anabrus simplex TaxID=316456 RepID=UPI0035A349A4
MSKPLTFFLSLLAGDVPASCCESSARARGCGDCVLQTDIKKVVPHCKNDPPDIETLGRLQKNKTNKMHPMRKTTPKRTLGVVYLDDDDDFRDDLPFISRFSNNSSPGGSHQTAAKDSKRHKVGVEVSSPSSNGVSYPSHGKPADVQTSSPKTPIREGDIVNLSQLFQREVMAPLAQSPPSSSSSAARVSARRRAVPNPLGEYSATRMSPLDINLAKSCPIRVPRIYYATRTHIQLEQVAREIRKTPYHDARTIILSSREQSCIRPTERRRQSKTELCHELHDPKTGSGCFYHISLKQCSITYDTLSSSGVGPVVDVQSLVQFGKKRRFCPYFAARELMDSSDIILCPVNYIIDPLIRKSMDLDLKGEIILVDEAHGLEDMCRDAASLTVSVNELHHCIKDCEDLIREGVLPDVHRTLMRMFETLVRWVNDNQIQAARVPSSGDMQFVLRGTELLASLQIAGVTKELTEEFIIAVQKVVAESQNNADIPPEEREDCINSATKFICEHLVLVLGYLYANHKDYVGAIECLQRRQNEIIRSQSSEASWGFKLLCQNAALVFKPIAEIARSIILASATLSPIPAMAAELGISLPNAMSSDHVVPDEQMWIGCISHGPTGEYLSSSYQRSRQPEYIDEVGRIVLDVCQRVPYGVLVFVTAYWLLETMVSRWKDSGLWAELAQHKVPLCEVRDGSEFVNVLKEYYATLEQAKEERVSPGCGQTGPLLIAVMRAKISEGYNFADDAARALITVGIPFPSLHEDSVSWKKAYNVTNAVNGLQHGDAWYSSQAFRALSQALGRGLRHSKDWCAMLMVEDRLTQPRYAANLPLWIQKRVVKYRDYRSMLSQMSDFTWRMLSETSGEVESDSDSVILLEH